MAVSSCCSFRKSTYNIHHESMFDSLFFTTMPYRHLTFHIVELSNRWTPARQLPTKMVELTLHYCCIFLWNIFLRQLSGAFLLKFLALTTCQWTLPLDFAHLETGQYKNSSNAWKLPSKTTHWDPIAAKRCGKKIIYSCMEFHDIVWYYMHGVIIWTCLWLMTASCCAAARRPQEDPVLEASRDINQAGGSRSVMT